MSAHSVMSGMQYSASFKQKFREVMHKKIVIGPSGCKVFNLKECKTNIFFITLDVLFLKRGSIYAKTDTVFWRCLGPSDLEF